MKSLREFVVSYLEKDIFTNNKNKLMQYLQDNPAQIYFLTEEEQTEELQMLVVTQDPFNLFYISKPTINVIFKALELNDDVVDVDDVLSRIKFHQLDEDCKMKIIQQYEHAILYIQNPTKELCMYAIREHNYDVEVILCCVKYLEGTEYEQELLDNLMIKDIIE